MSDSIFRSYDIRGVYPTQINEESLRLVACALARMYPEGDIIFAHDVRLSSPELYAFMIKTFTVQAKQLKKKFKIHKVGLATTPMFYFLMGHMRASGGVVVTASHNPKEYNGLKMMWKGTLRLTGKDVKKCIETHHI